MILTGSEIQKRIGSDIIIEPFNSKQLNPNSYNLKLDRKLLVYKDSVLDMKKKNEVEEIIIPERGLLLKPEKLYLGRTVERTETYNLVPMLEGRSSIGRLGVYIHVTAGFGDVGFQGVWTLELQCIHPIWIYPNVEIAQIYYHTVLGGQDIIYKGKYNFNNDVQASMLYKDFEK